MGYRRSTDGGANFTDLGMVPPFSSSPAQFNNGDPALVVDSVERELILVHPRIKRRWVQGKHPRSARGTFRFCGSSSRHEEVNGTEKIKYCLLLVAGKSAL